MHDRFDQPSKDTFDNPAPGTRRGGSEFDRRLPAPSFVMAARQPVNIIQVGDVLGRSIVQAFGKSTFARAGVTKDDGAKKVFPTSNRKPKHLACACACACACARVAARQDRLVIAM